MIIDVRMDESFKQNKERSVRAFELEFLRTLLARNNGNLSECARSARMDRKYLSELINKYVLKPYLEDCRKVGKQ